jgi:hypothetical protein
LNKIAEKKNLILPEWLYCHYFFDNPSLAYKY